MRELQKEIATAWISKDALKLMIFEFRRTLPNETGGILIGYWLDDLVSVVIIGAVGPGPCAKHDKNAFVPDHLYHESEVARFYKESGRVLTYLGDWHSHPNSITSLSSTDRHTLLKIAKHKEARAVAPVMAILGETDPLVLQVWQYRPAKKFGIECGKFVELQIRKFL